MKNQLRETRVKKNKEQKNKKKQQISSAYHRHLQLPHGGARDKMMSASAPAGTGRKRKHELVSGRHRLPHIHTRILLLSLHTGVSLSVQRRDVRIERRVRVRRRTIRRWLVCVHRRRGAHVLMLGVWLLLLMPMRRVRLRREPRLRGLEHVYAPELIAMRRQMRIREALRWWWLRRRRR
jgi:hypothetical protein